MPFVTQVFIDQNGSSRVKNGQGQTIVLNGKVQPGLSERDARDAAELLTPITFSQKRLAKKKPS